MKLRTPSAPMTRYERWSLIVSIIGIVIQILAFAWVIITLRESDYSFKRGVYGSAATWIFDLDRAFIEKPYLRPYFYDGKTIEPGDKKLHEEALAMAEYMSDTFEIFLTHRFKAEHAEPDKAWLNWMDSTLNNSPILQEYLTSHETWLDSKDPFFNRVYLKWKQHPSAPTPSPADPRKQ